MLPTAAKDGLMAAGAAIDSSTVSGEVFISAVDNKRANAVVWHPAFSARGVAIDVTVCSGLTLSRLAHSAPSIADCGLRSPLKSRRPTNAAIYATFGSTLELRSPPAVFHVIVSSNVCRRPRTRPSRRDRHRPPQPPTAATADATAPDPRPDALDDDGNATRPTRPASEWACLFFSWSSTRAYHNPLPATPALK